MATSFNNWPHTTLSVSFTWPTPRGAESGHLATLPPFGGSGHVEVATLPLCPISGHLLHFPEFLHDFEDPPV
jgi:hypothetical protein